MEPRLEALTTLKAKKRIEEGNRIGILPVGSVEQHGPHCPLGTDAFIARVIALGVAEKLDAICLPPLYYGVAAHHMNFAGSITVTPQALTMFVQNIVESMAAQGLRSLLVLNAHGGNTGAIAAALVNVREKYPDLFLAQSSVWLALNEAYETLPPEIRQDSWRTMISHAGLFETSVVMAVEDGLVDVDQLAPVSNAPFVQASDPAMTVVEKVERFTPAGYGGDPTPASAELGRRFIELSVEAIIEKFNKACRLVNRTCD